MNDNLTAQLRVIVGVATLLLIIAHVAAALYHQFILKDNLLKRMAPH